MQPQKTHKLRRDIFRTQLILILILAVLTAAAGVGLNISAESRRRDQNLQNVAESIAHSQLLIGVDADGAHLMEYVDSLQSALTSVDVISVVGADGVRRPLLLDSYDSLPYNSLNETIPYQSLF